MPRMPQVAQLMEPEDLASWELLPHEPATAFHGFGHYRDLPSGARSVQKAWQDHVRSCLGKDPEVTGHKLCPNRWRVWGTSWNWQQRARDWDREVDRKAREKHLAEQLEARTRHKKLAEMSLGALSIPVRASLMILQDPAVLERMVQEGSLSTSAFLKIIDMVTWATKNMPGLIEAERLSLGMSTESVEIGPKPEQTGLEIAKDAQSTELAIALVSRLANAGASDSDRAGDGRGAGDSGREVADGPALGAADADAGGSGAAEDSAADRGDAAPPRQEPAV